MGAATTTALQPPLCRNIYADSSGGMFIQGNHHCADGLRLPAQKADGRGWTVWSCRRVRRMRFSTSRRRDAVLTDCKHAQSPRTSGRGRGGEDGVRESPGRQRHSAGVCRGHRKGVRRSCSQGSAGWGANRGRPASRKQGQRLAPVCSLTLDG